MSCVAKRQLLFLLPVLACVLQRANAQSPLCEPECIAGRGLCIDGRCFCRSPYIGGDCGHDPTSAGVVMAQTSDATELPPPTDGGWATAMLPVLGDPGLTALHVETGRLSLRGGGTQPPPVPSPSLANSAAVPEEENNEEEEEEEAEKQVPPTAPSTFGGGLSFVYDDDATAVPPTEADGLSSKTLVAGKTATPVLFAALGRTRPVDELLVPPPWRRRTLHFGAFDRALPPAARTTATTIRGTTATSPVHTPPYHVGHRSGPRQRDHRRPWHGSDSVGRVSANVGKVGAVAALASSSLSQAARAAAAAGAQFTFDPEEACVPWLAELRSADLLAATEAGGLVVLAAVVDMNASRHEAFRIRTGSDKNRLEKGVFLANKSLDGWFHGPPKKEAEALFDRLDQSPQDGALTYEEYNWENLCGYRRQLFTATAIRGEKFHRGFNLLNPGDDHKLDKAEFVKASTGSLLGVSEAAARAAFAALDVDGSGFVDRPEFLDVGGLPRLRMGVAQKEPEESAAFKESDKDKDGYLNRAEFEQHAVVMGGLTRSQGAAASALRSLDTNRDGLVAKAEYVSDCQRRTSGTCALDTGCEAWRGPATCDNFPNGICTCALGFCAKSGACIPEELHAVGDYPYGHVMSKTTRAMEEAEKAIWAGPAGSADLSKTIAAAFLVLLLMQQIKGSLSSFPRCTLAILGFAISAYIVIVGRFVLEYKPVSGSLDTHLQMILFVATCFTFQVCCTSGVMIVGPTDCISSLVINAIFDDDVPGVSEQEAWLIRIPLFLSSVFYAACIVGPFFAPIPGLGANNSGKQMLCMIYLLILCMHTLVTEHQVEAHMKSSHPWVIAVSNTVVDGGASAKGAEWNTGLPLKLRRSKPVAWTGAQVNHILQHRYLDANAINNLQTLPPEGALYYIPVGHDSSRKQCECHYVRGRVLLIWEGTSLELVQPGGPGVWYRTKHSAYDKDYDFPVPTRPDGEIMCPWLRVSQSGGAGIRGWEQQAMHVATQAGAIGLIIGLEHSGPAKDTQLFKGRRLPVADLWPATYEVENHVMSGSHYARNWQHPSTVRRGSAVDCFVVSLACMCELQAAALSWDRHCDVSRPLHVIVDAHKFSQKATGVYRRKAAEICQRAVMAAAQQLGSYQHYRGHPQHLRETDDDHRLQPRSQDQHGDHALQPRSQDQHGEHPDRIQHGDEDPQRRPRSNDRHGGQPDTAHQRAVAVAGRAATDLEDIEHQLDPRRRPRSSDRHGGQPDTAHRQQAVPVAGRAQASMEDVERQLDLLLTLERQTNTTLRKEDEKPSGPFETYIEILEGFEFMKSNGYRWVHLMMTSVALFVCLRIAIRMARVIQANGYVFVGECIAIVMSFMSISNCAFTKDWYPTAYGKPWGPGKLVTSMVIIVYGASCFWCFLVVLIAGLL